MRGRLLQCIKIKLIWRIVLITLKYSLIVDPGFNFLYESLIKPIAIISLKLHFNFMRV